MYRTFLLTEERVVLITKSKTVTSTVLIIERQVDNNNNRNEKNEYVAGGEHSGIVINKVGKYGKHVVFSIFFMCITNPKRNTFEYIKIL